MYSKRMAKMHDERQILDNIASNLERLMAHRELTQLALAAKAKILQSNVSRIVNRVFLPNVAILARIADALDCTLDDLIAAPTPKPRRSASRQPA